MNVATRDLNSIWHPCSQMKDYETFPPLPIAAAQGAYLTLENGQKIIDAISSWWCKSLGHGHPRLKEALLSQTKQFEHVIFANTTYETIVQLSEKLLHLTSSFGKVFYASEGSSAVEIALKMAIHAQQLKGKKCSKLVALKNGYHGETLLALAVSDLALYKAPYADWVKSAEFISPPYLHSTSDPIWNDAKDSWAAIEAALMPHRDDIAAIIFEPIVQGAGGMQIYSQDFLKHLRNFTQQQDIYLIADEIMTGIGRTGKWFACEHAGIWPDLLCLGKGLTGGFVPFSAVLLSDELYQLFYNDYSAEKSFLHSHTFSGHALGASVALACLQVFEEENMIANIQGLEKNLQTLMQEVATKTHALINIRGIGGIVAADLNTHQPRLGYQIYQKAVESGALLRPLGNTIYWLPPLNTSLATLKELRDITISAINSVMNNTL